ncbi:MAG TPA: hypothetical protein VM598_13260 [Bdellovibrionota bacterium]|nr:hypothetical protein [Bdellovibrionota bacterium]
MKVWLWALPALLASSGACFTPIALADDSEASIVIPNGNLLLDLSFVSVEVKTASGVPPTAVVKGKFTRPNWNLGRKSGQITLDQSGEFQLPLLLTGIDTRSSFFAVGIRGQTETQEFVVRYPDFFEARNRKSRRVSFSPGISISSISYRQTSAIDFNLSQLAVTGKLGAEYPLSSRWSLGASAYITLLPITNPGDTLRFLGVNLRAAYHIWTAEKPWALSIAGGLYYTTTLVTGGEFGFFNLTGPQIFPQLRRNFNNRNIAAGYLKYSLISYGSHLLSPSQSEIAGGMSYAWRMPNGNHFSANLDIARLGLVIPEGNVTSTSVSVGVGYNL